jgi:glutamyl-tRNA synthetase
MDVITRFAPSPTGNLNIGGWRAGLFAYLFAKHEKGKFILRIEDTDTARSKKEFEDNILDSLKWMKIVPDQIYRQSEHAKRHEEVIKKLIAEDKAYVSKEEPKEEGERSEVIRFRNSGKKITFDDIVHGSITFDTTELGDFVIAKSLSEPIFHFALVVDDWDEGVTHVIRGEDHISNTPRQILIQEAIGAPRPAYAHLPLVLGKDRSKLSKRKGAKAITEYRELGYLPEALLNYDAFLGWHPGGTDEVFSLSELIERFTLDQVEKSPAIFDEVKLLWFNREHILKLTPEVFLSYAKIFLSPDTYKALDKSGHLAALVPIMRERIGTFAELTEMDTAGEFSYYIAEPQYEKESLVWKKNPDEAKTVERLRRISALLELVPEREWHDNRLKEILWPYAESEGRGEVLWPMRYALSGREKSPDPFIIAGIIGKDETQKRINHAVKKFSL